MSKVIIINVNTGVSEHFCEVIRRADEEVVSYDVRNHFLIQISIRYLFPVGVLKIIHRASVLRKMCLLYK